LPLPSYPDFCALSGGCQSGSGSPLQLPESRFVNLHQTHAVHNGRRCGPSQRVNCRVSLSGL
jgi:hypothetical protein